MNWFLLLPPFPRTLSSHPNVSLAVKQSDGKTVAFEGKTESELLDMLGNVDYSDDDVFEEPAFTSVPPSPFPFPFPFPSPFLFSSSCGSV